MLLAEDGLTPAFCERLAHRFDTIPLDFCLCATASQLPAFLQQHPGIVQFVNEKEGFLQDWQAAWPALFDTADVLKTGVAIAPTAHIQTLLMQLLGHCSSNDKLSLTPGQLSVIHYPKNHRPIVQAINI